MYASILRTYTEIHFENKDSRLRENQKEKRDRKFVCANDNNKRRVVQHRGRNRNRNRRRYNITSTRLMNN